jgi:transcriptional regulator with XRE-family HTH domain
MPRRAPKHDYAPVRKEYVTSDVSINELARRLGISNSTLAERARGEGWYDERAAYKSAVAKRSYEGVADKVGAEKAAIENERVNVLRATLRRYAQQLVAGEINVTPKDAIEASKALKEFTTDPSGNTDGEIIVPVGRELPAEWLRRVLDIARERGTSAGDLGSDSRAGAAGSRVH